MAGCEDRRTYGTVPLQLLIYIMRFCGVATPYESCRELNLQVEEQVRSILDEILGLDGRTSEFEAATPLLGALPELDSMAVIGVLNALEEHFDFAIGDDEVDGTTFESFGTLVAFVRAKLH